MMENEEEIKKSLVGIEPRKYQLEIFETAKNKNTLVVLPTGMGKSLIGLMISIHRLVKYPEGKILILAPTRPLAFQWLNYFKKHSSGIFASMELFTGKVQAEKRNELWNSVDIIFST